MTNKLEFGKFCWNELATPNAQAAKDFYGKVFGWKFSDVDMGDFVYTMIQHHDNTIAGMWSIPKELQAECPPHWLSYILVENVEQSLQLAEKNGAKVVRAVAQVGDMGLFAIITDPTGAHIALWQSLK